VTHLTFVALLKRSNATLAARKETRKNVLTNESNMLNIRRPAGTKQSASRQRERNSKKCLTNESGSLNIRRPAKAKQRDAGSEKRNSKKCLDRMK
jgi:hypothetical protein